MASISRPGGPVQVGIPATSTILTPQGWRQAKDLRMGDVVLRADGASTVVMAVQPRGVRPVWEARMRDGTRIAGAAEHPVPVHVGGARERVELTMAEVGALIARRVVVRITETQPVELSDDGVRPLDAYLLAALLAEGSLGGHSPVVWTVEPEIITRVEVLLPPGARMSPNPDVQDRCVGHRLIATSGRLPAGNPVTNALRELGLWGCRSATKFVPDAYSIMAPIAVRRALLNGLLDCDGSADPYGKITYSSASPLLAHAVAEVVRSLGGRCSEHVREKVFYTRPGSPVRHPARTSYTVSSIRLPGITPFLLERKAARVRPDARGRHWTIVEVRSAGAAELMTIETLHPSQPILMSDFCPIYGSAAVLQASGRLVAA